MAPSAPTFRSASLTIIFAIFVNSVVLGNAQVCDENGNTNFFYDIGGSPAFFWSCTCGADTNILSTVNVSALAVTELSQPQLLRTINCFERERRNRNLNNLCKTSPSDWQDHSEPLIKRCAHEGLRAPSSPPVSIDESQCTATTVLPTSIWSNRSRILPMSSARIRSKSRWWPLSFIKWLTHQTRYENSVKWILVWNNFRNRWTRSALHRPYSTKSWAFNISKLVVNEFVKAIQTNS